MFIGLFIAFAGHLFTLVVMGGSTRNLVAHLLHNDPVSARAAYSAVRARFWGLMLASFIVLAWIGFSLGTAVLVWYTILVVVILGSFLLSSIAPVWFSIIVGTIGGAGATALLLWLFFYCWRVAYVPQVMLVEGKGVLNL
jgi:hypothetical protein